MHNRVRWYRIPEKRSETLNRGPRKKIIVRREITKDEDLQSPPTRQSRKDYTAKTPTTVSLQEVIKSPRGG